MMLNSVVFPEPLGPIRAVTVPSGTSSEQSSTAATPPKRLPTPSTSSSALTPPLPRGASRRPPPRGARAGLRPVDAAPAGAGAPALQPVLEGGQDAARQQQHDDQE